MTFLSCHAPEGDGQVGLAHSRRLEKRDVLAVCRNQAGTDAEEFLRSIRNADVLMRQFFFEIAAAGPEGCRNLFSTAFLRAQILSTGRSRQIAASTVQSKLNRMQKMDWILLFEYGCYAVTRPRAQRAWMENLEEYRG